MYILSGVPLISNGILIGVVMAYINARIGGLETSVNTRFNAIEGNTTARFNAIDNRFDDLRDLWRAELRRVEEILDARLKHMEEK